MDNELMNLCKEVYEHTKWGRFDNQSGPLDFYYHKGWNGKDRVEWVEEHYSFWQGAGLLHVALERERAVPLYTSDYLLERIVKGGGVIRSATLRNKSQRYIAHGGGQREYADTPLKALLKLTIALDDAGVKL